MDMQERISGLEQDVDMGVSGEQVPVHISHDEVIYFNILQDGQSVDQDTGLREYSKLSFVLQNPNVRELLFTLLDVLESGEDIPEDLKAILETPSQGEEDGFEPIESDYDPHIQEMAQTGTGNDKVLVMMPTDVVELLDSIQGGESKDPTLGLQQFGFFSELGKVFSNPGNVIKSIARVVSTVGGGIGGYMLGGPMGAAAGAGLGNMVGRGITGQKFGGDMLRAGAMNGLMGYGAGTLAASGALGAGVAGMGGASAAGAGAAGAGLGATGAGVGAAGAGVGAGQVGAAPIVNGIASTAPGITAASTPYVAGAAAKTAAAAAPSFLSQYGMPLALAGGALFMSRAGQKKQEAAERPMREKDEALLDEYNRKQLGKYSSPYEIESVSHEFDPRLYSRRESSGHSRRHYKTGGKVIGVEIKGKGTGQSDEIPRTVPENAWVWDATTVAHLGDGSTKAGHKAIDSFEKMIKRHKLPHVKEVIAKTIKEKPLRKVPCALSDGERVTMPHGVAAVGEGSFDKGATILRKMTKELRRHKASKGLDLPPAAHDLTVYYKKALRGE